MELIYCNKNIDELENQSKIFLVEIKEKFAKENILENMKLLIEFILLSMHCEQQPIFPKDRIEYNETKLKKDYNEE